MKKFKIILAFFILIVVVLGFSTLRHDEAVDHDIEMLKKDFVAERLKKCLKDSEHTIEKSIIDVEKKCKEDVEKWWQEVNIMNDAKE